MNAQSKCFYYKCRTAQKCNYWKNANTLVNWISRKSKIAAIRYHTWG